MNSILLFMGLGMQEMLLIGLVILIFFGAKKIPEFMKGLGKGVREFKDGIKEVKKDNDEVPRTPTTTTTTTPVDENRD
ncbi:MAG TPA: twin-arginine translocase TatA/TatE family subunit [Chryseosolibacter sp.]|nr:twin-arginine translocase TatA/TatE family subunit [Chryseosolibacter sp.]